MLVVCTTLQTNVHISTGVLMPSVLRGLTHVEGNMHKNYASKASDCSIFNRYISKSSMKLTR